MAALEKTVFYLYIVYSVKKSKNFILATKTGIKFINFMACFKKNLGKSRVFGIFRIMLIVKFEQIMLFWEGENCKNQGIL